ncbi:MAG: hypothetical protein FJW36_09690 [Acidobacteria bacterium]|nr:hypothetical protein [Acidobacteriota bacterium]
MKYLLLLLSIANLHAQCTAFPPGSPFFVSILPPYNLPTAEVGSDYSYQFRGTAGKPPYVFFTREDRPVPSGLTLDSSGLLSGRPIFAKPDDLIAIFIRDSSIEQWTNFCEFRISVIPNRLAISSTTLPRATVGVPYSTTLAVSFGTAPFRFELLSGAYPPGIQGFSNGVLSGTPTAPGTSNLRFRVIDANNNSASANVTLIVEGPAFRFETTSLPNGEVGLPYAATLRLTGTTATPTFQLTSGALPPGLTLQSNTISGTPNTQGTFNFNIRATTSAGTADAPLSIRIAASTQPFSLQDLPLSRFTNALPVATRIPTIGGQGTPTFTLIEGIIPAGLQFSNTGEISGTPRGLPGTYTQRWRATDLTNSTSERTYTITIEAPRPFPAGIAGQRYSQREPNPGRYTLAPSSRLPLGLALSPDGTLAGTPFAASEYTFALRVEAGTAPIETRAYSLAIAAPPNELDIDTLDLPAAPLNTNYQQQFITSPAATAIQLLDGALPPGLSLLNNSITGTPTTLGFYEFLLDIRSGTRSTSRRYAVSVEPTNRPFIAAITNAASYQGPAVTPGQIVTLFGTNLDGIRAPNAHILYTTPNQSAIILPYNLNPARLKLVRGSQETIPLTLRVLNSQPGIFTADGSGRGLAAALYVDSIVILFGTGLGSLDQPVVDGQPTTAANLATIFKSSQLTATINGIPATILYAGTAPGLIAGVDQLNIQIPPNLTSGQARLKLSANGRESNEVLINVP